MFNLIFGAGAQVVELPECTLCGKNVDALSRIELEGTIVEVCADCVKFGRVVETKLYKPLGKKIQLTKLAENNTELAADYGMRVKKAREERTLTCAEFAQAINERESVIKRIEGQSMTPDDALTRKIEQFLEIKLKERYKV